MNILVKAIQSIASTYPTQSIKIIKESSEIISGMDYKKSVEIKTTACVQQLKGSEVKDYTTYIDSNEYFRFYIVGDDVKIVSSALYDNFTSARIIYNGKFYRVYYREDWGINGWVIVDGVCQGVGNE